MKRVGLAAGVAIVAAPVLIGGPAHATSAKRDVQISFVNVRVGHHRCANTQINGINNRGTVLGTELCGHPKVFIRTRSGKTTFYALPKTDAKFTYGGGIASDGTMALEGAMKKKGPLNGFIVSPKGVVTPVADPSATGFGTSVEAVNRHGTAVGSYCTDRKCRLIAPFIYRNGTYKTVTMRPKHAFVYTLGAIADNGDIGGTLLTRSASTRAFVKRGHHIRVYDAPHTDQRAGDGTFLTGFGTHGTVCGTISARHHHTRSFFVRNGHEHVVDLHPRLHKAGTSILSCNSKRQFAGIAFARSGKSGRAFVGSVR